MSCVYVVAQHGHDKPVKVGWAASLSVRLIALQTGNPTVLEVVAHRSYSTAREARDVEASLHRLLSPYHHRGEWFAVARDEAVAALNAAHAIERTPVRSLIDQWPTIRTFASDIECKEVTARQWGNRNSIPAKYWPAICQAAVKRGFTNINLQALAHIHAGEAASMVAA